MPGSEWFWRREFFSEVSDFSKLEHTCAEARQKATK